MKDFLGKGLISLGIVMLACSFVLIPSQLTFADDGVTVTIPITVCTAPACNGTCMQAGVADCVQSIERCLSVGGCSGCYCTENPAWTPGGSIAYCYCVKK